MEKLNYFIIFVLLGLAITCLYFSTNKKSGFQNPQKYDYYPVNTESNDYKSINDINKGNINNNCNIFIEVTKLEKNKLIKDNAKLIDETIHNFDKLFNHIYNVVEL